MKTSYASATISAITLAIAALSAGQAVAQDSFSSDKLAPTGATYRALFAARDGIFPATGKTREQVQAEVLQARANGDTVAPDQFSMDMTGRTGATYREIFPARYGVPTIADTKTRADVRAEFAEARRTGDLPADAWINVALGGVAGSTLRDVFPSRYPARAPVATAQQVIASK